MDFILFLKVVEPIDFRGHSPELHAPLDDCQWRLYGSVSVQLVFDAVRALGEAGVRVSRWSVMLNEHDVEQAAAFRLVNDENPETTTPKSLLNPRDEFDPDCPHPGRSDSQLLPGHAPNLSRKPRGDFGFVNTQPIVRKSVLKPLERFGVRLGVALQIRGEPSDWFTVEVDTAPIIDVEATALPKLPCWVSEQSGDPHWLRTDFGMLIASPEMPESFGWSWDQQGWNCLDYERWLIIDHDAYDFLHHKGHKRAGEFSFEPIYAPDSECAEVGRELRSLVEEHLIDASP